MELYLFGAGASAFSGDVSPKPPPLGDNAYLELRKACRAWRNNIPPAAGDVFRSRGFEAGLAVVEEACPEMLSPLLTEMGRYFLEFEPGARNLYRDVVANLDPRAACLATLNYDMLLEEAVADRFGGTGMWGGQPLGVLKLHGSGAIVPVKNDSFTNMGFVNPGGAISEGPCDQLPRKVALEYWSRSRGALAPAMAMYAEGKRVLHSPSLILELQSIYEAHCRHAERIYLIGLKCVPADSHIWKPLIDSPARLVFANPTVEDGQEFLNWASSAGISARVEMWELGFREALKRRWPLAYLGARN